MITPGDAALLVAAGVVAGTVGSAGGITSLISYPALLAVGVAALPANIVNIVALVACWPGSASASRPELEGKFSWVLKWGLVSAVGGAIGAGLLLLTPARVFQDVVPFLVATASIVLLAQPRISEWNDRRSRSNEATFAAGLLPATVYNGYFGAGAGVMLLALLLVAVDRHVQTANALKNMLLGAASIVSALILIGFGSVDWRAVIPLAVGMFFGSMIGPRVARRMPGDVLRYVAALIGLGLAIRLFLQL